MSDTVRIEGSMGVSSSLGRGIEPDPRVVVPTPRKEKTRENAVRPSSCALTPLDHGAE
ncbi:MAG: hypothetical protein AAGN66_16470 [Acidobacteriota bacterium]